jgi:glycerophosphoryl diester phosphodiesterase
MAQLCIIGHRGCHGHSGDIAVTENTLPAFQAAIDAGADMVELDVWRTADDGLVVYHDEHLPGEKAPITSMSAADVQRVVLPGGGRIPLLADVLLLVRGHLPVNVEIKHGAALDGVLTLVRTLRMTNDVLLSSFDLPAMYEAAERAPAIARALIMGTESLRPSVRFRESFPFWHLHRADAQAWHPAAGLVCAALVEALRDLRGRRVRVNAWTVNDPVLARRLVEAGVDGVFTDRPDRLRRSLDL